ncbi:MAG: hypothetical protein J7K00_03490 [Candidatus Diapherotrites archaeon]|nr:hypothetical protein [Candidatus Diapherotrites archaeon]
MGSAVKLAAALLFWILAFAMFLHVSSLKFSDVDFQDNIIKLNGKEYEVVPESYFPSTYDALLETKNLFFDYRYPFLMGDLVVTTGGYRGNLVNSRLADHHLYTEIPVNTSGAFYVIHPIAANSEIAEKIRNLKQGRMVWITGIEVYKVNMEDGRYWIDDGCHTLLVTEVVQ